MMFQDIPIIDVPGATVGDIISYGAGTYVYQAEGIGKEDYRSYLALLEKRGFCISIDNARGLHDVFYNAVLKKDCRIVSVLYVKSLNRMYVTESTALLEKPWTGEEVFRDVPDLKGIPLSGKEARDCGAGNYMLTVCDVTKEDYLAYLGALEERDFLKYADNSEGLDGHIFYAVYKKDRLVLSATFAKKQGKLYLSACFDLSISEHLMPQNQHKEELLKEGHTKLHMLELFWSGNSFVIQMKNGHFLVSDGGTGHEADYLFDYLDSLTPEGEKPVIEGWFITHTHIDHSGVLRRISAQPEYGERAFVEGIYYNEPGSDVIGLDSGARAEIALLHEAAGNLRTTEGAAPKVYRPQTGQKYYFEDIRVDILLGQEQIPFEDYSGDFNESSTWYLFNIEGQKCLLAGDGDKGGMKFILENYDRDYMKLDLFSVLHHGHNTRDMFTDYCEIKTVLLTRRGEVPAYRKKENDHLRDVSLEWFSWDEGTRVFTFPYRVGTSELLPHFEWIYHKGQERPN